VILCLGLAADDTFCYTLAALKKAHVDFVPIDFIQLIFSGDVGMSSHEPANAHIALHGTTYRMTDFAGIFSRLFDVSDAAPSSKLGSRAGAFHQILSRILSHPSLRVMNRPMHDHANFAKLYHTVSLASAIGWLTPRSCLTNVPSQARDFIESCPSGAIFKGASSAKTWCTVFDPAIHTERLHLIESCPVLFQEYIQGMNVRIHVVGHQLFSELILSKGVDYRSRRDNVYGSIDIPRDIAAGCAVLAQIVSVPLFGVDFLLQEETGKWFFLEANSLPAYEGYDRRAGGKISDAIVEWLAR
jgi:glutathione synthase/RimK-type ligase-like ATP-grasp enzyme